MYWFGQRIKRSIADAAAFENTPIDECLQLDLEILSV
jgi:hypothetical protein